MEPMLAAMPTYNPSASAMTKSGKGEGVELKRVEAVLRGAPNLSRYGDDSIFLLGLAPRVYSSDQRHYSSDSEQPVVNADKSPLP